MLPQRVAPKGVKHCQLFFQASTGDSSNIYIYKISDLLSIDIYFNKNWKTKAVSCGHEIVARQGAAGSYEIVSRCRNCCVWTFVHLYVLYNYTQQTNGGFKGCLRYVRGGGDQSLLFRKIIYCWKKNRKQNIHTIDCYRYVQVCSWGVKVCISYLFYEELNINYNSIKCTMVWYFNNMKT